jgi:prefoldin alpha subunit
MSKSIKEKKSTKTKEMDEETRKELYYELRELDEEIKKLNTHLENVDEQLVELNESMEIVNKFTELKNGDELRVPLTAGIYLKGEITDASKLMINVGQGVTVEKPPKDVLVVLNNQLTELNKYRTQIVTQMKEFVARIEEIQKMFE